MEVPHDAEIVIVDSVTTQHGVFRINKIILNDPRKVTDELAMGLYLKSTIPEKLYYKALAGLAIIQLKDLLKIGLIKIILT